MEVEDHDALTERTAPAVTPPLSRQRRYQQRHAAAGLCRLCGRKAGLTVLCRYHARLDRQRRGIHAWHRGKPGRPPDKVRAGKAKPLRRTAK